MFGRHGSSLSSRVRLGGGYRRPFGGISKLVMRKTRGNGFRGAVHPPTIKNITTRQQVGGFDSLPTWSKLGMSYGEWKSKGTPPYVKK